MERRCHEGAANDDDDDDDDDDNNNLDGGGDRRPVWRSSPVRQRSVHVFVGLTPTLGVVDCGAFVMRLDAHNQSLVCAWFSATKRLQRETPAQYRAVMGPDHQQRGTHRPNQHGHVDLFVVSCGAAVWLVVGRTGASVAWLPKLKCGVARFNSKWMVEFTSSELRVLDLTSVVNDPPTKGLGWDEHRDCSGGGCGVSDGCQVMIPMACQYVGNGEFFRNNCDVLVITAQEDSFSLKAWYIDLPQSFVSRRLSIVKKIDVPMWVTDLLWCGDALCTVRDRRQNHSQQLQEMVVFNTETKVVTSFQGSRTLIPFEKEFICFATGSPQSPLTCQMYHSRDLSVPCATIQCPSQDCLGPLRGNGVIAVPSGPEARTSASARVELCKLYDAATGYIVATLTGPRCYCYDGGASSSPKRLAFSKTHHRSVHPASEVGS
ncbi:hypothetical protein Pelo_1386 [Pelomyxa schiedti]|nr:hypothetical protein Pelo_1386 [Pelomyxa schiedti]